MKLRTKSGFIGQFQLCNHLNSLLKLKSKILSTLIQKNSLIYHSTCYNQQYEVLKLLKLCYNISVLAEHRLHFYYYIGLSSHRCKSKTREKQSNSHWLPKAVELDPFTCKSSFQQSFDLRFRDTEFRIINFGRTIARGVLMKYSINYCIHQSLT